MSRTELTARNMEALKRKAARQAEAEAKLANHRAQTWAQKARETFAHEFPQQEEAKS